MIWRKQVGPFAGLESKIIKRPRKNKAAYLKYFMALKLLFLPIKNNMLR